MKSTSPNLEIFKNQICAGKGTYQMKLFCSDKKEFLAQNLEAYKTIWKKSLL